MAKKKQKFKYKPATLDKFKNLIDETDSLSADVDDYLLEAKFSAEAVVVSLSHLRDSLKDIDSTLTDLVSTFYKLKYSSKNIITFIELLSPDERKVVIQHVLATHVKDKLKSIKL